MKKIKLFTRSFRNVAFEITILLDTSENRYHFMLTIGFETFFNSWNVDYQTSDEAEKIAISTAELHISKAIERKNKPVKK